MTEQRLPPVTELGVVSMALIVTGGITIAAQLPGHVALGLPVALLAASALIMVWNVVSLARAPGFNRPLFIEVARWALLAYCVIAGILEWVFVKDGTRERDDVPHHDQHRGGEQRDRQAERDVAGQLRGDRDPAGDDQRHGDDAELGDRRQALLAHPVATLVMITRVATCIAPVIPAV